MFAAALISVAGSQLTYVAIPWFVLQTTGSATRTGVVFAVELVAGAACGIPSGAIVERLGARRTLLLADAVAVPLIAAIPIAHGQGWLSFPLICAISAGTGMLSPAYLAATTVALTGLVGREDAELLTRANGHLAVIQQTGALGGKAVAGLLVAMMGATNVLSIDAASYAISFLILFAALPSHPGQRPVPRPRRARAPCRSAGRTALPDAPPRHPAERLLNHGRQFRLPGFAGRGAGRDLPGRLRRPLVRLDHQAAVGSRHDRRRPAGRATREADSTAAPGVLRRGRPRPRGRRLHRLCSAARHRT